MHVGGEPGSLRRAAKSPQQPLHPGSRRGRVQPFVEHEAERLGVERRGLVEQLALTAESSVERR
jgi:hypothetical protein